MTFTLPTTARFIAPATATVKASVSEYRRELNLIGDIVRRVEAPSCTSYEVIGERTSGLLNIFRFTKRLQAMVCPRATAADMARHQALLERCENAISKFEDYFFNTAIVELNSNSSLEVINRNMFSSTVADERTYIKQPELYPAQHIAACQRHGLEPSPLAMAGGATGARRVTSNGSVLSAV
jgi:hypothetical protein